MRDRPVIELTQTGRGRGLGRPGHGGGSALSNLPAHGLAPILVQSEVAPLPRHEAVQDFTIHVFITTAVWPSAAPDTPNTPDPGAMDAIRDHGADAVATALGLTDVGDDLSRRGDSEARRRSALIASLIPRGSVELAGGELAVSPAAWTDSSVTYDASGARQPVMMTVCIWHVDYPLADEAAALVAAELSESTVMWPGDYVVPVHLEALTPAVWDVFSRRREGRGKGEGARHGAGQPAPPACRGDGATAGPQLSDSARLTPAPLLSHTRAATVAT